jgi:hypothetical protein
MFKRVRWFGVGVVAGAGTAAYGFVRLRESRSRLAPDRVAETVVGAARTVGRSVGHGARKAGGAAAVSWREAVAEGRTAMADAEERITADLDRPPGRRFSGLGEDAGQ